MKFKLGVPEEEPSEEMKNGRKLFESLFQEYFRYEPTCTSTTGGKHMKGSKHYDRPHNAEDYRFPEPFRSFMAELKKKLGNKYDLVIEKDHFHLEVH